MNVILRRIILGFLGSFILLFADAQINFSASLTPTQINKDEYTTLRFMVQNANNIQKITPPSLSGFIIVSGPNQESGMSSVNGKVDQYIAISYVLQPRKPGKINIGAATATIAGQDYKSNPLTLVVLNKTSGNNPSQSQQGNPFAGLMDPFNQDQPTADYNDYILHKGENIAEKVSKNMQIRLQTDKTSCYVGEPIVATYKLYTRLKSDSRLDKNPSFNGFSVIDLQQPDITAYDKETLNGREYNVYTIRKAQLYPLQSGPIQLEAATLNNKIDFVKEGSTGSINGALDGFGIDPSDVVTQNITLSSKPVIINVKPLPDEGKPANFKGAVGDFKIDCALAKNNFSTDETGALTVTITGSGNLQLITAPDINWPQGIDAFQPKLTDNLVNTTVPVSGNKVFKYAFAAQKAGSYILPALTFSFFNPKTEKYKTVSTEPISLTVSKGTGIYTGTNVPVETKDKVSFLNAIFSHRIWMIAIVAIIIFMGLFAWLKKDAKKEALFKLQETKQHVVDEEMETMLATSAVNQQNPLQQTESYIYKEDSKDFFVILNSEIKTYLANKFSLPVSEINTANIAIAMDKLHMDNNLVLQMQQLMQEIELQVYTPYEQVENKNEMYGRCQSLIQLINTYEA